METPTVPVEQRPVAPESTSVGEREEDGWGPTLKDLLIVGAILGMMIVVARWWQARGNGAVTTVATAPTLHWQDTGVTPAQEVAAAYPHGLHGGGPFPAMGERDLAWQFRGGGWRW